MKDRRDSWAAVENIIPSSSGAAKALQFIWKDLKMTGKAYRVPTRTGSIAEINERGARALVSAVRRDGIVGRDPAVDTVFKEGDVVVLYGTPEALEHAETVLLMG